MPSKREKIGWAIAFATAFVAFSVVYFALPGAWGADKISGDGWDSYVLARSMLFDLDVDHANEIAHCCNQSRHQPNPKTGRIAMAQPVGTPLLWLPFLAGTHAAAWVRSSSHDGQALDGYGHFYFVGTAWASVAYGVLGLLFVFLFLRRRFSLLASALATVGICFATPLFFYIVFHPGYSHSTSMFAVALFVWAWDRGRGDWSVKRWLILGALTGLVALVRAQDVGIVLLPIAEALVYLLRREGPPRSRRLVKVLRAGAAATLMASLVFLPQLLIWRYQLGALLAMPQGSSFMQWDRPSLGHTFAILFGSRNGLVSWHPVYLLSMAGLLIGLWRAPRFAGYVVLGLLWPLYVNGVVADLWGGWAFGHRRMLGQAVLFAWGLALFFETVRTLGQDRRRRLLRWSGPALAVALLVPLIWLNSGMTAAIIQRRIRPSDTQDMRQVYHRSLDTLWPGFWSGSGLRAVADLTWKHVGNPASAPAVLYFRLAHGISPRHFDEVVGNYLLYRFNPNGQPISFHLALGEPGVDKYLVKGHRAKWRGRDALKGEDGRVWLALPAWLLNDGITVRFQVQPEARPTLKVRFNGEPYTPEPDDADDGARGLRIFVPLEKVRWGFNRMELEADADALYVTRLDLSSRH